MLNLKIKPPGLIVFTAVSHVAHARVAVTEKSFTAPVPDRDRMDAVKLTRGRRKRSQLDSRAVTRTLEHQ